MMGQTFCHYEIMERIGSGGMGEVYRARDAKLGRDVALKVLPQVFARDAERMARFQREAQLLASLNHPNIAAVYGLEESGEVRALVMELVEGPTLAERISGATVWAGLASPTGKGTPRGAPTAVPLDEALPIARQIAEGLEYAHDHGIIHRDLKPANVKVRPDGTVKILDFGLAKALEETPAAGTINNSPTISAAASREGMILGTAAYMSPEQARGKTVDRRCDIWSFGAVFFEMLSGKQAFPGEDVSQMLAAVIMKEPDWSVLPDKLPAPVGRLLRRCLTKDPRRRLQAVGDARIVIEETLAGTPDVGAVREPPLQPAPSPAWRQVLPWALAVVFLLGAIVSSVSYWRLSRAPARTITFEIGPPEKTRYTTLSGVFGGAPAISPDGRILAFLATDATGKTMLWVRSLDSPTARPLPGTEGASGPFWSADNRSLGFFADDKLKTIETSGGPSVTVAEVPGGGGGSWNRDGTILFSAGYTKGIYRVSASGGTPAPVIAIDTSKFSYYSWPRFLPDGKHFLYVALGPHPATTGTYFASLDGKERCLVLRETSSALYASGYLLYPRGDTVVAQAFDAERGQLKGDPHPVVERIAIVFGRSLFDVSENGILVYRTGGAAGEKRLTWFDRTGKNLGVTGEVGDYWDVRLSPDGAKLASNAGYPAGSPNCEIWVDELARGVRVRLTIDPDTNHGIPVWSPDGSTILFGALSGKSRRGIYRKPANGAGSEELLLPSENSDMQVWPTSWSRDGRFILYSHGSWEQADIWVLALSGDRKPRLFVQVPVSAYDGQFSPNGRWVAYTSKESGREEVYVVPFDATRILNPSQGSAGTSGGGKWQISSSGGHCPRWRGDGKEIFYLSLDNQMMAAEVEEQGNGIEVRRAQALFRAGIAVPYFPYDVTPDGKKFVINTLSEQNTPLTLVVNWTTNLKKQ